MPRMHTHMLCMCAHMMCMRAKHPLYSMQLMIALILAATLPRDEESMLSASQMGFTTPAAASCMHVEYD